MTTPKFRASLRITLRGLPPDSEGSAILRDGLSELGGVLETEGATVWHVETHDRLGTSTMPELSIAADPTELDRYEVRVHQLARYFSIDVAIERELHEDRDWWDAWKAFYQPLLFGRHGAHVLVRPSWIGRRPNDPPLEVVLDPGRAFGTGQHETTQLCIEMLCRWADQLHAPGAILDMGCGSGILALVAARLFPDADIVALDSDIEAVEVTRENAAVNDLSHRVQCRQDSVATFTGRGYSSIIANLRPDLLIPYAPRMVAALAPEGRAVLSGILEAEGDAVAVAWERAGARILDRTSADGWCALEVRGPA